ncbi:MAG: PQQ-binding-like beta-propeller repeat protein [Fuerstiella sp.]|nr:PQQ-binding-like beta-propeller repeat protein [Fuerstiella sp.]
MPQLCTLITGFLTVTLTIAHAADWQQFRGPDGSGISHEKNIPVTWGPEENIAWQSPLPGPGNSSPIVSNGRVFVTCATDQGKNRGLHCFDRRDGTELWNRTVRYAKITPTHAQNPYGASTPVADGRHVVVWHGTLGLYCYDFNGHELWHTDLGEFSHVYGYASSPVIHDAKVILNFGPGERTFMTAVDLHTGEILWQTKEPGGFSTRKPKIVGSFSTPMIVEVDGREQIICTMPTRVVAYDPHSGDIIWTCDGLPNPSTDLVYTSPLIADGIGVAMTGARGPAFAFRLGGSGNVTDTNRLWGVDSGQPDRLGSGVIIEDHIYVANADVGTAQCLELQTGNLVWRARLPGANWGSIVYADGRMYVTGRNGTTSVFVPNPAEMELVASNKLDEPSDSTPAISNGQIFLRTDLHLFCIGQSGDSR